MRSKYAPVVLVLLALCGATVVAVLDAHYRDGFMRLTDAMVVGFWSWMQHEKD
jgi:hypothetical protein